MFGMQYDIRLPRDYDMGRIRTRVATRGSALDDYTGLGLKAYLIRDVATGAPVNAYAPIYLWLDAAAAARFLWGGGGFAGIVRDFSRPPVRTWVGGEFRPGRQMSTHPTRAVTVTHSMHPDGDPSQDAEHAKQIAAQLAQERDTHSVSWMIDPTRWDLTFLILGTGPEVSTAVAQTGQRASFELLHLSAPGLPELS